MKNAVTLFIFSAICTSLQAQQVSNEYYWVVESFTQNNSGSIVKFYDLQDQLVHEIKIEKKSIDINKARHKRMVEQMLKRYKQKTSLTARRNKSRSSI